MKKLHIFIWAAIFSLAVAGSAAAQKKPKKPVAKKTTQSLIPPLEVRTAREKVDNQLSNVNDFLLKLGPLAVDLETAVADARNNRLSAATAAKVEQGRERVVISIRDLRLGLSALESDFRTKPNLQRYLSNIQGISDLAAESEDAATAGQFVAAKDPLRRAAQKLTDTLTVLPR